MTIIRMTGARSKDEIAAVRAMAQEAQMTGSTDWAGVTSRSSDAEISALIKKLKDSGFVFHHSGKVSLDAQGYPMVEMQLIKNEAHTKMVTSYEGTNIRCDTVGDKGQIQKLSYLDLAFTLKTMLPLDTLTKILRGGAVTTNAGATEKMGIGQPNNQQYYRYYLPVVYDETAGDYLAITAHKAQFVDAWEISFSYGEPATVGMIFRAFADDTLPAAQLFATIIRADPSAI